MLDRLIHSRVRRLAGASLLCGALLASSVGSTFAASTSDDPWANRGAVTGTTQNALENRRDPTVDVVTDHPRVDDVASDLSNHPRVDRTLDIVAEHPRFADFVADHSNDPRLNRVIDVVIDHPRFADFLTDHSKDPWFNRVIDVVVNHPGSADFLADHN